MFLQIRFLGGPRAPVTYFYKNRDLFKPAFWNRSPIPLRLTEFKEIEVITANFFGATVKCTFTDDTQGLAFVTTQMLQVIQGFLFNVANAAPGQIPAFPKNYINILFWVVIALLFIVQVTR